jgi:hypothetical protein
MEQRDALGDEVAARLVLAERGTGLGVDRATTSRSTNVTWRCGPGRSEYVPATVAYRSPSSPTPSIARTSVLGVSGLPASAVV